MSKHGYTKAGETTSTPKAGALCNAIYSKAKLPGYCIDMCNRSGGIGIFIDDDNPDQPLCAYATPFWEGCEDIEFQLMDDAGNILADLTINRLKWTGDIEKDIEVWAAAVAPLVACYLPLSKG